MKLLTFILLISLSSCKQHSKPLVIQENKPPIDATYFNALSDSMRTNLEKSMLWMVKDNRDSVYWYAGKGAAYTEMENKEQGKR